MLLPAQELHTQTGLPDEGSCYFAFTALDAEGLESDLSNEIVKHFSFLPPGKPLVALDWYESTGPPVAIVIESATLNQEQLTASGDIGLTMPATRPDNDLYLAPIAFDGGTTLTTLSGWTAIVNSIVNGTSDFLGLVAKYGSSEPASYTLNRSGEGTERGNTVVLRISGAHASDPFGAASSISEGTGTTATAPAVTAESSDSIILRIYAADDTITGFGSGTDVARDTGTVTPSSFHIGVSAEASPGVGVSTGTNTASVDSSVAWAAITIEILPAASGGGAETGSISEGAEASAAFVAAVTKSGLLSAGVSMDAAFSAVADAIAAISAGIAAAESKSAQAAALASVAAALEAGETGAASLLIPAAFTAGLTSDAQIEAIAQAVAAIEAGLEAGESWAAQAAVVAGLTAGTEAGATFAATSAGLESAAIEAGTSAAASFLAAAAAYSLIDAGISADAAFAAAAAAVDDLTAGGSMGAAFTGQTGNEGALSGAVDAGVSLSAAVAAYAQTAAAVSIAAAMSAMSAATAAISAGVSLGATFVGITGDEPEAPIRHVIRAVQQVRTIRVRSRNTIIH